MSRAVAAVLLALRFVWAVVVSGVQTLGVILRHGLGAQAAQPGFVRVTYAPLSPFGTAVLGGLVSLTPGTTVVEIDPERHEMVMHLLDVRGAEAAVRTMRRDFEPPLRAWFGVRP